MGRAVQRRFTMIRDFSVADALTLGNGVSGMASILATCQFLVEQRYGWLWLAVVVLPAAAAFDFFDGRVARKGGGGSALGAQLDSLADLISFGVAPAVLGFAIGLRGGWDALVLVYFVVCGLSRLARYNVTAAGLADDLGKVRYFEGTPIPTSLVIVAILAVLLWMGAVGVNLPAGVVHLGPADLHPVVLLYALSGSAMISKTLRIPKP